MKTISLLLLALVGVLAFSVASRTAYADCQADIATAPINDGNDNINCSGGNDADGVNTGAGNDTVTTHAATGSIDNTLGDGIVFGGNGTVQGDGAVIGEIAVNAQNGTVTNTSSGTIAGDTIGIYAENGVTNSGNGTVLGLITAISTNGTVYNTGSGDVIGSGGYGIVASGNVVNTGSGDVTGRSYGISVSGNVTNSGSGTVSGILGNDGDQIFTLASGTITGSDGSVVADDGWDTVSILVGNVTITGMIDGGTASHDILRLVGDATHSEYVAAQALANICNATPAMVDDCSGSLSFGGKTYTFQNFEQLLLLLQVITLDETSNLVGTAPLQTGPVALCDGSVKVFRQPNGDLDVYSGFDALPPNGFLVGRITTGDVAAGITRFQDAGIAAQQGWFAEITRQADGKLIIQVFDGQGNPVGNSCTA